MNTEHDLAILTQFLRRMAPEIEGHDAGDPPAELAARLDAFASGKAAPAERAALAATLKEHPEWLSYLARAIRTRAA
ncbi:MAG: hypothetical protein LDL31_06295 [Prosthecobacter sp.]|jgi:hypothetical protein|nr:hypothetical protein [Prosthecobacter sp.]